MNKQYNLLKRMILVTLLVALALPGSACNSPAEPQPKVTRQQLHDFDHIIELAVGQSTPLPGLPLTVTFSEVSEDSRCPIGAVCIWSGNGRTTLVVQQDNQPPDTLWLNTDLEPMAMEIYPGHELRLLKLQPHPELDVTIDPESYRITLQLTALPEN